MKNTRAFVIWFCIGVVIFVGMAMWLFPSEMEPAMSDERGTEPLRFREIPLVVGQDYPTNETGVKEAHIQFSMELDLNKLVKVPTNSTENTNNQNSSVR